MNSAVQFMALKLRMQWMKEYSTILNSIGIVICKNNYIHANNVQ